MAWGPKILADRVTDEPDITEHNTEAYHPLLKRVLADQLRHGEGCQGENNIRGKTYTQQRKYILRVGEFVTHY